jgi:transcriptional regulator with XRE-family HTH domain
MSIVPGPSEYEDEPVGPVLARMRRAKGLTGIQLAALVGTNQPKISRIERGKGLPDPEDVATIARALGASESTVLALRERAQRSHDRMTDWRPTSISLAGRQRTVADWEATARVVRIFEPAMMIGLLQTSGYARAVLQAFQRVAPLTAEDLTESALLAAVTGRVKRQEVLADQTKSFQFIVGEAALKRGTYPVAEMLAQISHVREVAGRNANVSITVVPDGAPAAVPLLHGFTLFDDDLVLVDLYNTGLLSHGPQDVASYRRVFDLVEQHAVGIDPLLDKYEAIYIEMLRESSSVRRSADNR